MATQQDTLNEDLAAILCLAICSDGIRKKVEEQELFASSLFTHEVKANYDKYIKLIEMLQSDGEGISIQMFPKIIAFADRLTEYSNKRELFNLINRIIQIDNVLTQSEEQFLEVLKTKWKI